MEGACAISDGGVNEVIITVSADGGMPFFFADRKVFNPRDYPAGVGMPLIRQEAHDASGGSETCDVGDPWTCTRKS